MTKSNLSKAIQATYDNGRVPYRLGRKHTEESKRLMSERLKQGYANGRVHNLKGKTHSAETIAKMSKPKVKRSTEARAKSTRPGGPRGPLSRVTCPHCFKEGASNVMSRYQEVCPVTGLLRVQPELKT